ncbi:MAG: leukotriene A4 hydrolase C-terminal domain-containing protein, partial [Parvularculaceae bacterium]
MNRTVLILAAFAALAACGKKEKAAAPAPQETVKVAAPATPVLREFNLAAQKDQFSYANVDEVKTTHVDLTLTVDFASKTLDGTAILDFVRVKPDADALILDTDDLTIDTAEARIAGAWSPAVFVLGTDDPALGAPLQISIPPGADAVRIGYRTSPEAQGLQWLTKEQTAGKRHPYMYSQNQAIHARSMAPLQDTPSIRITYTAGIRTPEPLVAVMSAVRHEPEFDIQSFDMPQPIPSYLIALAVGDIAFKAIDDQVGVWAEPEMLDAAVAEFSETPQMVAANSALYGPYRWERYDMLVLPPSFPFGGMENPRLTFLTPTAIAGDKSLTSLIAHELAHSWSGNLVTNATWRDSWLNEGVTSYVENRVVEAVFGPERAAMERALDLEILKRDVAEAERPELTQLKLPADLKDPDEGFSQVAYVKGAFLLKFLEERFGREAFDQFLKAYFDKYAFKSVTTEDFVAEINALRASKPDAVSDAELREWINGQGVPASVIVPQSDAFDRLAAGQQKWLAGSIKPQALPTAAWTTQEWLRFINTLPEDIAPARLGELDAAFKLSTAGNSEIAAAWYLRAVKAGYEPALPEVEKF